VGTNSDSGRTKPILSSSGAMSGRRDSSSPCSVARLLYQLTIKTANYTMLSIDSRANLGGRDRMEVECDR